MKSIVKARIFKPTLIEDGRVGVLVYELLGEKWSEQVVRAQRGVLDRLLAIAQNSISILESSGDVRDKYALVDVEYPGLRASRGDGAVSGVEVVLYPIPQPARSIAFLRREGGELREVHRVNLRQEKWVFDSAIKLSELDFDAILVETAEDKRVILREEIVVPPRALFVVSSERRGRKRKRGRRRKRERRAERGRARKSKSEK